MDDGFLLRTNTGGFGNGIQIVGLAPGVGEQDIEASEHARVASKAFIEGNRRAACLIAPVRDDGGLSFGDSPAQQCAAETGGQNGLVRGATVNK